MAKVVLLAAGKISGMIETVGATGLKYQALLHDTAVQCLAHAEKHGDRSLLARLIGGSIKNKKGEIVEGPYPGVISKATSGRELRLWVQAHSPLRWDTDGAIVESKTAKAKGVVFSIEEANAEPFWELDANQSDRNRAINMDNLQNVIFGVRKRFKAALEAGKFNGDPAAMTKYLDAVEAVPLPKATKANIVEPDFKAHDEVEVTLLMAGKTPKSNNVEAPRPRVAA